MNKFQKMPREIAKFSMLEEPHRYTDHSFRRTSTTILLNYRPRDEQIKNRGGWTSSKSAVRYKEPNLNYKRGTTHNMIRN